MKVTIISALIVMSCLKSQAQLDSNATKRLGDQLMRYSRVSTAGISLQALGIGSVITGACIDARPADKYGAEKMNPQPFYLVGGGLFFIGFLVSLAAQSKLHEAGFILKTNGIGYDLPIRKRR